VSTPSTYAPARLETTAAGGHVAFVAGSPFWPSFWAERRAVEFLAPLAAMPVT